MPSMICTLLRNEIVKATRTKLPYFGLIATLTMCTIAFLGTQRQNETDIGNAWGFVALSMQIAFTDIGVIFVVIADCHGERIFHTGLPFQGDFLTYRTREVVVEAGTLGTGQALSAFVEFPIVVDSKIVDGIPGFTSFANSTYLDLHTAGPPSDPTCPAVRPPMDTGQTDRSKRIPPPGG